MNIKAAGEFVVRLICLGVRYRGWEWAGEEDREKVKMGR